MASNDTKILWPVQVICNGSINPLIRTTFELRECCPNEKEYQEALRWLAIEAGQDSSVRHRSEGEARQLMDARQVRRRMLNAAELTPGTGLCSTAQLLAKHGNLECRAKCRGLWDLLRCLELHGDFNGFEVSKTVDAFRKLNRHAYYGSANCNTGNDALEFSFGLEGSLVVYVALPFQRQVLTKDWRHWHEYGAAEFKADCERAGRQMHADESDCVRDTAGQCVWRFWWD